MGDEVLRQLERIKWFLWHGNVYKALQVLQSVLFDLEMAAFERDDAKIGKLWKAVQEFHTYITAIGRSSPTMANATETASGSAPGLWSRR